MGQRAVDAIAIESAYEAAESSLERVLELLRTTEAGRFMWAENHKDALSGIVTIVHMLRCDVPNYGQHGGDG